MRFAAELATRSLMVRDATASFTDEQRRAAPDVNIPNYASAILTRNEVVDSISSIKALGISAH